MVPGLGVTTMDVGDLWSTSRYGGFFRGLESGWRFFGSGDSSLPDDALGRSPDGTSKCGV